MTRLETYLLTVSCDFNIQLKPRAQFDVMNNALLWFSMYVLVIYHTYIKEYKLNRDMTFECPAKAAQFDKAHQNGPRWGKHHAGAKELAGGYTKGLKPVIYLV